MSFLCLPSSSWCLEILLFSNSLAPSFPFILFYVLPEFDKFSHRGWVKFSFFFFCLFFPSGVCIYLDLGMGKRAIPDSKITASSQLNSGTLAKNGRLNYTAGPSWCAQTNDNNPYLQIDLQSLHVICAVSTQGNSKADEWVETYTIQTSTDGVYWTDYDNDGHPKVSNG